MNFKLSQTTKDFFDVIRTISSYISIAAVGIGIILFTIDDSIVTGFFKHHKILAYFLGGLLALLPFILPTIYRWINIVALKKRKLSNIIIEKQDVIIDIVDEGRTASYYERVCFYKLQKKNTHYVTKLEVTGYVDPQSICTLNCFYKLNSDKKRLSLSYVNKAGKMTGYSNLLKSDEKSLTYSAVIKDTFIAEEESWDLYPTNYCISFNLSMVMPIGKTILYAKIFRSQDGHIIELDDIHPIIFTEHGRCKLIVQIVDYDYGDYLSIKWKLT